MKEWIKEKLKIINELYPTERMEKSKERYRRLWSGEEPLDRLPFVLIPTFGYYDHVFSGEEGLHAYLDEFINRGFVNDDFIPSFFQGCRMGMIPSMFGAKEIVLGNDYTCGRIMETIEDGANLRDYCLSENSVPSQWLKLQRYYLEETEGNIPVHVCDMQGPLDAAGQMWGYENLLAAPYEEPEIYEHVMDLVTGAFICLWKEQQKNLGNAIVPTHLFGWDWVPENNGVSVSTDSLAMISPSFFDDFYRGYLERISHELGRLTVHSCGQFGHLVKELYKTDGLIAVNAGQMTIEQLLNAGISTDKIIVNRVDYEISHQIMSLIQKNRLKVALTFRGLWPKTDPSEWSSNDRKEILNKAAEMEQMCYM